MIASRGTLPAISPGMASDLVVVQRGRTEIFEALQRRQWPPSTLLIWDRRVRDRRVILQDVLNERRCGRTSGRPGSGMAARRIRAGPMPCGGQLTTGPRPRGLCWAQTRSADE
jgi:hypothetical protein